MDSPVPSLALAAYAEPLIEGRRVLALADATTELAERLLERGARLVHVYDPDAARAAAAAGRNRESRISIAALSPRDLPVRDGSFDVAVVADLSAVAEPEQALRRLRRALSPRGIAIIASPNADAERRLLGDAGGEERSAALGYYDLYDAIAAEFSEITMVGQTPFVGFALVDFAATEDAEVNLDMAYLAGESEESEWYVAVASRQPIDVDALSVVQLPLRWLAPHQAPGEIERGETLAHEAKDRAEERKAKVAELEAQVAQLEARVAALDGELAARDTRMALLDGELAERDRLLEQSDARLERATQPLESELVELRGKLARAESALEDATAAREAADAKMAAEDVASDVATLEDALRRQAAELRTRERELRDARRIGRELVRRLASSEESDTAAQRAKLDRLAELNARLHADLEAARWTIGELEGRLFDTSSATGRSDAEAQESIQRELEQARAETERLAALVERLRAEAPDAREPSGPGAEGVSR